MIIVIQTLIIIIIYILSVIFAALPFILMNKSEMKDALEQIESTSSDKDRRLTKITIMIAIFMPILNTSFALNTIKQIFKDKE